MLKSIPIFILTIVILASGCKILYIPNEVNTPMLAHKKEFSGNIATGTSTFDVQGAFSPVEHLGVMLNGTARIPDINPTSTSFKNRHLFGEAGIGYYYAPHPHFLLDVYGGVGYGKTAGYDRFTAIPVLYEGSFLRTFIQPSMSYLSDPFDANLSLRTSWINMRVNNETPTNTIAMDPTITLKYGWQYIKLINQLGVSVPITTVSFPYNPIIFNIGINLNLKTFYKQPNAPQIR